MAENKVSDTVNDMVNSMVEDINSAQNGSNKVSAIKDNVGYDMSRVHSANLKILKEIDRICRKYKIQYALDAGTLIGAVRHKGFIPWDDDADIVFTRNQFEAFKKSSKKRTSRYNGTGRTRQFPWRKSTFLTLLHVLSIRKAVCIRIAIRWTTMMEN